MSDENAFVPFVCPSCHQEIEASRDMIGQPTECPACGVKLVVPEPAAPAPESAESGSTPEQLEAMKSRTIRIELGDL